jgi:hypothetical protein
MTNQSVIFHNTPGKYKIALPRGNFLFELWGASGGRSLVSSSRGAYVSGQLSLCSPQTFYAYVGEKGTLRNASVTFNGGGGGRPPSGSSSYSCSGGGATDVRLIESEWNNFESLKSRIIVAGGGGGETKYINGGNNNAVRGGHGGFLSGEDGSYSKCNGCGETSYTNAGGGKQQKGGEGGGGNTVWGNSGEFGVGGTAKLSRGEWGSSGGGGGYFGGGAGGVHTHKLGTGAGGSSFVSGYSGCSAVSSSYSSTNEVFSGYIHYSGIMFHNIIFKDGNETFASPTGSMNWDYIDGAIKITFLDTHFICECNNRYTRVNLYRSILLF